MIRPRGSDRCYDFKWEAHSICEVAAVTVGALVGDWREEFIEQITMRAMDFDDVEAGAIGAPRGGDEGVPYEQIPPRRAPIKLNLDASPTTRSDGHRLGRLAAMEGSWLSSSERSTMSS